MTPYKHDQFFTIGEPVFAGPVATICEAIWDFNGSRVWYYNVDNIVRLKPTSRVRQRVLSAIANESRYFHHPNLPDIIATTGPTEKVGGFFARLPEGQILVHKLQREGKLDPAQTLKILRGVTCALRVFRDRTIAPHRGPTVDRVWVGSDGEPVLLGWGEVLTRNEIHNAGARLAPEIWWHLPPEVLKDAGDNETADERVRTRVGSDNIGALEDAEAAEVWTLGTLAYFCLTGVHPYYREGQGHQYGVENTLENCRADYPADVSFLGPVIDRALAPDPHARYESAEEFVEAFAEILFPGEYEVESPSAAVPTLRTETVKDEASEEDLYTRRSREADLRVAQQRAKLWTIGAIAMFAAFIFLIILDLQRPRSILITSEPNGIELVEVTGHLDTPRGRTPLILTNRKQSDPITLRTVGPAGDLGDPLTMNPAQFDDLGRCLAAQVIPQIVAADSELPAEGDVESDAEVRTEDE